MDGWVGVHGEVVFREDGDPISLKLFASEDAPVGSPEPLLYVYVAAFHLIERPMLAWVPEDSLDAEGGYMVPLPRWNARVSVDGDIR